VCATDSQEDKPEVLTSRSFLSCTGPNTTGFWLYGVRADPQSNSAFTRVVPGGWHTYRIRIPADHPTGLYW
jgi:hypothetical protein